MFGMGLTLGHFTGFCGEYAFYDRFTACHRSRYHLNHSAHFSAIFSDARRANGLQSDEKVSHNAAAFSQGNDTRLHGTRENCVGLDLYSLRDYFTAPRF
jgi:hypothetical protein